MIDNPDYYEDLNPYKMQPIVSEQGDWYVMSCLLRTSYGIELLFNKNVQIIVAKDRL